MASSLRLRTRADLQFSRASPGLSRTQPWTAAGVWGAAVACWLLLLWGAIDMASPVMQLTMPLSGWSLSNWGAVFAMWVIMMGAMMLPSAAPMVLSFAALNRKGAGRSRTLLFIGAYLALWAAFGGAATILQWGLQSFGWITPMIVSTSVGLSATLLLIAGVFQFSPLKRACLRACRSPLGFLISDWRQGLAGAWHMGVRHGLYCLGCCWALMTLLSVGGAMNLPWIAALASLVAIEKLAPRGQLIAQLLGGAMIGTGIIRLV
jgi:predicted metal-binding membrane protein